jgi:hypothetical protein
MGQSSVTVTARNRRCSRAPTKLYLRPDRAENETRITWKHTANDKICKHPMPFSRTLSAWFLSIALALGWHCQPRRPLSEEPSCQEARAPRSSNFPSHLQNPTRIIRWATIRSKRTISTDSMKIKTFCSALHCWWTKHRRHLPQSGPSWSRGR